MKKSGKEGTGTRAIDCAEVMRQLFEYLDGEVDAVSRSEIMHHLDDCRSCFSRVEFEKALKEKVKQASRGTAPDSLRQKLDVLIQGFAVAGEEAGGEHGHANRARKDSQRDQD
ncbi:MAG TPA: mycothiol system anti-sigma-R factor [Halothiobacillaceae bacterium]|nr:mycothiol system anti-sigma-R factor [Halothiobacillaceae bacterium]